MLSEIKAVRAQLEPRLRSLILAKLQHARRLRRLYGKPPSWGRYAH